MHAGMVSQVDALQGDACEFDGRLAHLGSIADDREDAAVMDGIAAPVQNAGARGFDGRDRRLNRGYTAPLRKIRHDFKQHECRPSVTARVSP